MRQQKNELHKEWWVLVLSEKSDLRKQFIFRRGPTASHRIVAYISAVTIQFFYYHVSMPSYTVISWNFLRIQM